MSHPSGKDYRLRDISINKMLLTNKDIHLKHDENTFTISFSSISFQYQNDIVYTYLMEDFRPRLGRTLTGKQRPLYQPAAGKLYLPRAQHKP